MINTQLSSGGVTSADFQSSYSASLSLFFFLHLFSYKLYPLWLPPDSQLCLLNSGDCQALPESSYACVVAWGRSPRGMLSQSQNSPYFPSILSLITICHHLMGSVLSITFLYVFCSCYFRREDKSSLCYSILTRSRNSCCQSWHWNWSGSALSWI